MIPSYVIYYNIKLIAYLSASTF